MLFSISRSDSEFGGHRAQRTSSVGEKSETSSSHAVLVKEYMKDVIYYLINIP